jgi:hypothetical protein
MFRLWHKLPVVPENDDALAFTMQQSGMTNSPSESSPDREQEKIEQKLLAALEEPAVPMGKNFWTEVRRTAHARAKASAPPNHQ